MIFLRKPVQGLHKKRRADIFIYEAESRDSKPRICLRSDHYMNVHSIRWPVLLCKFQILSIDGVACDLKHWRASFVDYVQSNQFFFPVKTFPITIVMFLILYQKSRLEKLATEKFLAILWQDPHLDSEKRCLKYYWIILCAYRLWHLRGTWSCPYKYKDQYM